MPDNFPPGQTAIVNTASVSASNADTKDSSVTVTIDSPVEVALAVDKDWQDNNQTFDPGSPSTIGLDVRNTSNVNVETLTLQEPKAAANGAGALDASNPFTITDFAGFDGVGLPAGCESVRVDAYVKNGGTWSWVQGTPTPTPSALALPGGVTNADVGGVRIVCTGDMAPGQQLSVDLDLEQRATQRDTGADLSRSTHTVNNVATGSVSDGTTTITDDGAATYTVAPLIPTVEATKNIGDERITAGQSTPATVRGTVGADPVRTLHLADLDFFTDKVTFGGFTAPLVWPSAATSGSITYHLLAGGTDTVAVTDGAIPPAPSGPISGFEITWTGPIAGNETGGATFDIDTTEDATGTETELALTNTVDVDVTAANGLTDEASASDGLTVIDPDVSVELTKTVRPAAAVNPGDTVISSLAAHATKTGDTAILDTIAVSDERTAGCSGFWNAFDVSSIAPTQVPAGTVLTVEVKDAAGTWHSIATDGPHGGATVFAMSAAALATALSGAGLDADAVEGIRFTFAKTSGFAADLTITPNIVFTARGTLRDASCPTPPQDTPVNFVNAATSAVEGETEGGTDLSDVDGDQDRGMVTYPSTAPGPLDINKQWDRVAVNSQASDRASTRLGWNIDTGYPILTLTDLAGSPTLANVADSVYDAFDLVRINAVGASSTPYTSGWYLKYDTVTTVELYNSLTSAWEEVAAPGGSWMTAARGMKAHPLTDQQRGRTTGVRITLAETAADTAARTAARQDGPAFDPFAPLPGSGVGSGSVDRVFDLTWQLRDKLRSDGSFVIAEKDYNTATDGIVDNTVRLDATPAAGPSVSATDADTIQILDPDPLVEVAKSVTPTQDVHTPPVGTPIAEYPTATWTITGSNASVGRASYVRLTDPAVCTDTSLSDCQSAGTPAGALADPFDTSADHLTDSAVANPLERFDATAIIIQAPAAQVDLAASTVWLLHYDSGTYTTSSHTATAVNAMTPAQVADVVGISVTFQGSDPATTGGTISQDSDLVIRIDSRLRPTLRSSGADQVLAAGQTQQVPNRVFAQSYDPIANLDETNGDVADAETVLTGGIVNVTPTKSLSRTQITRPQHDADNDNVTVRLGANQGSAPRSTLSPQQVVIEDQADSAEFWSAFGFTGNVTITQMPGGTPGANQVQVDLYDGTDWVTGSPTTVTSVPFQPPLPGVALDDVQGIRLTWSRTDGGYFSRNVPAQNWSAQATFTANLRETYRTDGDPMAFPSDIDNTQTSQTTRTDGNDSAARDAAAGLALVDGTRELAVNKLTNEGNRIAAVGDSVPFDLTLRNTGTGYLTLTELADALPPQLVYLGDPAPTFTAEATGALSEDVTVTPSPDGASLVFTWPDGGDRMLPGETFVIRIHLELQPGLGSGQRATNTITAQTEEELARCTNVVTGGSTTPAWSTDNHLCGTSDYLGTVAGPNLYTLKGVRGSLPGAYQPGAPAANCAPSLTATGGSYYRPQCVANSQVGGTDDWVLHSVNAGTVSIDEMTIFDQLPVRGDQQLVSGSARDSAYRPQLTAAPVVTAPAGTTTRIEVTTSPDVCVGTWADLPTQPACQQSGEVWTVANGATDWSAVTGLRIHLDFTTTTSTHLDSGQAVDVNFSTLNVLANDTDDSGSSRVVPTGDEIAWNQHGVKFRYTGSAAFRSIAPSKVGVHLQTGSLQIDKAITGPAAAYADDEFLVDVTCRVGSGAAAEELDLAANATVELNAGNAHSVRIDGIPVSQQGTNCTMTEQGSVGEFGETSRSGTPTTVDVTVANDPTLPVADQPVPTTQLATITNDYQFTGLSLTKRVDTDAVDTTFGPFAFTVSCLSITGTDVTLDATGATELTFELDADETWNAEANRIPVGAECTVTEADRFFADHIVFTGDNLVPGVDGSAIVTPGIEPAAVEVTNAYDAGTISVAKVIDGAGANLWGTGTFVFAVECTYQGQTPYDDTVELVAGGSRTLGPYAAGTECTVVESGTAGATTAVLDPVDGLVTIPKPATAGDPTAVTVTATNTFDVTGLEVDKLVEGDLTAPGAGGPFKVALGCTWLVDGQRVAFDVPGGAERTLSTGNGYHTTYADLPSSAQCTLTETDTGGAAATTMTAEVVGVSTQASDTKVDVNASWPDPVARLPSEFVGIS